MILPFEYKAAVNMEHAQPYPRMEYGAGLGRSPIPQEIVSSV